MALVSRRIVISIGLLRFFLGQHLVSSLTRHHFSLLDMDDLVVGESIAEYKAKSSLRCSAWCSLNAQCFAYDYRPQEIFNCVLIYRNTVTGTPLWANQTDIYLKACTETWTPPSNWSAGDQPSIYRSFDNENYCQELINGASIVPGNVSNAVKTNSTFKQWVSLGNLSRFTCLPSPTTCGPEGAALTAWIRVADCTNQLGIISSMAQSSNGFLVQCNSGNFRYSLRVADGYFHYSNAPYSDAWHHLALVFHGPNDGEGISIYHDGVNIKTDASKAMNNYTDGSGTVIIGKRYVDKDDRYGSVMVDELTFWDRQLLQSEIQAIASM